MAAFLTTFVTVMGARRIVEVGTFTGYSALCLARGLAPGGLLQCFDVSDEWTSVARRYWDRARCMVQPGFATQLKVATKADRLQRNAPVCNGTCPLPRVAVRRFFHRLQDVVGGRLTLDQHAVDLEGSRSLNHRAVAERSEDNGGQGLDAQVGAHDFQEGSAVHFRHEKVQQDHVRQAVQHQGQCLPPVRRASDHMPRVSDNDCPAREAVGSGLIVLTRGFVRAGGVRPAHQPRVLVVAVPPGCGQPYGLEISAPPSSGQGSGSQQ